MPYTDARGRPEIVADASLASAAVPVRIVTEAGADPAADADPAAGEALAAAAEK